MEPELVALITEKLKSLESDLGLEVENDPNSETPLFGAQGRLDSMGLVSLVLDVESAIQEQYGKAVALADERAMSQRNSPYATIGSLAQYAETVLAHAE